MSDLEYDENYTYYYSEFQPCNYYKFGAGILTTLYSLIFILGFLGNALVVCVLVKYRRQTNLTDVCLLNLAVADLLFVISLPLLAHYASLSRWIYGGFLCRLMWGVYTLGFYSGVFFLVAMTLDRYMVIVYAHTAAARSRRSAKKGIAMSMFVWLFSLLASLPNLAFTRLNTEFKFACHRRFPEDLFWKQFTLLERNVLGFLLPLLVMVTCYSKIILVLLNTRTSKKHRVVRLVLVMVVVFFLFLAPYNIALFLHVLQMREYFPLDCDVHNKIELATDVTQVVALTHCCLNPILYAFTGQRFMKRVLTLLRMCRPRLFPL